MRKKTVLSVLSAAVLAMSLAACGGESPESSASGASGAAASGDDGATSAVTEQSVDEACTILEDDLEAISAKYQDVDTTDQEAVMQAFEDMMQEMTQAGGSITNAEVKDAWSGYNEAFDQMSSLDADIDYTDEEAVDEVTAQMEEISDKMQSPLESLQNLCPAFQQAADELESMESGEDLG